ncbi:winged helix-turn-helix domain-containing protein [Sphingosinicella sp. BN140058]|uniref:winged helix-turn-helix domain-containing protein n=1 Tax=Sphingosinicella sp. BN140058 TaxID=1892855 RepID=UPI001013440F|nr:LysR family transcriptional regulator [Sphingosinicella sp. BN140058]QAY79436.1 LysR family transcriptional regulator [Sphingosinicella sp. BN140058]
MPKSAAEACRGTLWFRILLREGALGPGKIDLMRRIAETGSISAAARTMSMSHARSVKLVAEINALGAGPLIETRSGGEQGGGAQLSERGRRLLAVYDALEAEVGTAAAPHLAELTEALHG